jgi:SAM-dependent methyltransferase
MDTTPAQHWNRVYATKADDLLSWHQAFPEVSLQLLRHAGLEHDARIVDVGAGSSRVVDGLLDQGFSRLTLLDLSEAALERPRGRLGREAESVRFEVRDVRTFRPLETYDAWHDRAVFHFMVTAEDRAAYLESLRHAVRPGGQVVLGTFAADGPHRCSGLPVMRYSPEALGDVLGPEFRAEETARDLHVTPAGRIQPFTFVRFVRASG